VVDDIKLVIFDLDGTLVHLPIDYEELKSEISKILKIRKVSSILDALSDVDDEIKMKIFNVWSKLELKALPSMIKIDEGIELYNSFRHVPKCLITLQGKQVVTKILERTGLRFNHIVTREDSVSRSKQIKIIIEKFRIKPSRVLVVGDRESDRKAAEENGCSFMFIKKKVKSLP